MIHRRHRRGRASAVGALVAGFLLFGACGASAKPTTEAIVDLQAKVKKTVADPARAAQALAALDSVSALVPYVVDLQSRTSSDLRDVLRNYRSTRADFEALFARWEVEREQVRTRALAAHERFKRALTDDEWKKLKSEERMILFRLPIVSGPGTGPPPKGDR